MGGVGVAVVEPPLPTAPAPGTSDGVGEEDVLDGTDDATEETLTDEDD
jgi:hypothetical protein